MGGPGGGVGGGPESPPPSQPTPCSLGAHPTGQVRGPPDGSTHGVHVPNSMPTHVCVPPVQQLRMVPIALVGHDSCTAPSGPTTNPPPPEPLPLLPLLPSAEPVVKLPIPPPPEPDESLVLPHDAVDARTATSVPAVNVLVRMCVGPFVDGLCRSRSENGSTAPWSDRFDHGWQLRLPPQLKKVLDGHPQRQSRSHRPGRQHGGRSAVDQDHVTAAARVEVARHHEREREVAGK